MNHRHVELIAVFGAIDQDVSELLFDLNSDVTQGVFQFKWAAMPIGPQQQDLEPSRTMRPSLGPRQASIVHDCSEFFHRNNPKFL